MTWQWVLGLHIVGIIMWLGGLMSLTRSLAHRARENPSDGNWESFEKKSYFAGVLPGMLIVIVTGSLMLMYKSGTAGAYFNPKLAWGATFHVKMTLVTIMIVISEAAMWKMRQFHKGKPIKRATFMALHGIAALLMLAVVVVLKANVFGPS